MGYFSNPDASHTIHGHLLTTHIWIEHRDYYSKHTHSENLVTSMCAFLYFFVGILWNPQKIGIFLCVPKKYIKNSLLIEVLIRVSSSVCLVVVSGLAYFSCNIYIHRPRFWITFVEGNANKAFTPSIYRQSKRWASSLYNPDAVHSSSFIVPYYWW
jgi:hypothetical protein